MPERNGTMQALSCSIKDAVAATGLSRSTIYNLIADDRIATVKIGKRRLVQVASLKALTGEAE
jgi:excisionase family DNA binding protein